MSGRRRGRVYVFSVCRNCGGITGTVRGGLGIFGGWRNIGGLLDYICVGGGKSNIGVDRLCKDRVREIWFLGSWILFLTQ